MNAKDKVRELLDRLPDDVSLDRILYHVHVLRRVEAGVAAAEAGDVTAHEQVEREFREWWSARRAELSGPGPLKET